MLIFTFFALVAVIPTAIAVYKLQPGNEADLVPNAKRDMLYLFQFPRTALTPSQAALNLKVESWLHWKRIPFHRLSNQFFLGSKSAGAAPFALYNGEFIDGSDAIVKRFGGYNEKKEEQKLRETIDDKLFKFLMVDRATRNAEDVGGLDFMLSDEGVVQQMVPLLVTDTPLEGEIRDGIKYQIRLNSASLGAYFNAYIYQDPISKGFYYQNGECPNPMNQEPCEKVKTNFLKKYLVATSSNNEAVTDFTINDWKVFSDTIRSEVIVPALRGILKEKPGGGANSSEAKLDQLLALNKYDGKNTYASLKGNDEKVLQLVKNTLKPFVEKLRGGLFQRFGSSKAGEARFPIIGNQVSPTDASLFGALIQYFETPLNIPTLRAYFQPEDEQSLSPDVALLKDFVKKAIGGLDLSGVGWRELTWRPWKLNYENNGPHYDVDNKTLKEKYNGPFNLEPEIDELDQIVDVLNPNGAGIIEQQLAKYPGSVKTAVRRIVAYVENEWPLSVYVFEESVAAEKKTDRMAKLMLSAMGAYICQDRSADQDCAQKHLGDLLVEYSKHPADTYYFWHKLQDARELTYQAIVEYNEGLVKQKVLAAIGAAKAAGAVSALAIGNEQ